MIEEVLYGSDAGIVGGLLAVFVCSALILFFLVFWRRTRPFVTSFSGIAPIWAGSVTTMFTFTAAFLGASVWGAFQVHTDAVKRERTALVGYIELVSHTPELAQSGLRPLVRDYIRSAIDSEWPMLIEQRTSPETQVAFRTLFQKTLQVASAGVSAPVAGALVRSIESVQSARLERIGHRWRAVEPLRWVAVLILGLLTQTASVVIHLDKPRRPIALVLIILTTLIVVVLGLIALSVNPYEGMISLSKAPLEYAYQLAR